MEKGGNMIQITEKQAREMLKYLPVHIYDECESIICLDWKENGFVKQSAYEKAMDLKENTIPILDSEEEIIKVNAEIIILLEQAIKEMEET